MHQIRVGVTCQAGTESLGAPAINHSKLGGYLPTAARAASIFVFCVLLAYAAFQQSSVALRAGETTGTALNWPIPAYLKTLFVIAVALMALQSLAHLVQDVRRLRYRGGA